MIDYTGYDYTFPKSYEMQVTQEMVRYELVIPGNPDIIHDASSDVKSWKEFDTNITRNGLTAAIDEIGGDITFVRKSKKLIDALVKEYGLYAEAYLRVYYRHKRKNKYKLQTVFKLNFQTYMWSKTDSMVTLVRNNLYEYLSSARNVKYDIPVSELTVNEKLWKYERIKLISQAVYNLAPRTVFTYDYGTHVLFSMTRTEFEIPQDSPQKPTVRGAQEFEYREDNLLNKENFILRAEAPINITIEMDFKIRATIPPENRSVNVWLTTEPYGSSGNLSWIIDEQIDTDMGDGWKMRHVVDKKVIPLNEGDIVRFGLFAYYFERTGQYEIYDFNYFRIRFDIVGADRYIPVFKPETLLAKLIEKIAPGMGYTTAIEWDAADRYKVMLAAAESVRQYPTAYAHTGISDFTKFMQALGYDKKFTETGIAFAKTETYFDPGKRVLTLTERETAGLKIAADTSYAYTSVKIGYEKPDYNQSVNGKLESNTTFNYTTGYTGSEETVMELISPYRADPIGVELLTWKEETPTTDNKADNDIFAIAMYKNDVGFYRPYDEITTDIVVNEEKLSLYNAVLNPYFLVQANKKIIGIITRKLTYVSTDGNREAEFSDPAYGMRADVNIEAGLFKPFLYDFACAPDQIYPDDADWNGLVYFEYEGKLLSGFIRDIWVNYSRRIEQSWVLYMYE